MHFRPLASIQMLAYNHAPYIRRAVDCVLSQKTDFPFELVIGEDCSRDGTREIVFEYERQHPGRVRVITSEQNVGMHRNVVRTQHACRGEFLAFCEGDDFWHDPMKLQTQVEFLQRNPDYGMTHCNYNAYEVTTGRLRRDFIASLSALQDDDAYCELLLRKRRVMTLTVCVRRDLLECVVREQPECTDENWPMGDTQRWLEISRLTKVKYFPKSMATYNYLPESASQSQDIAKAFRFAEKAGLLILHYLAKYPVERSIEFPVRRRVALEVMAMAYRAKDRNRALQWMQRLKHTPGPIPVEAPLYLLGTNGRLGNLLSRPAIWILLQGRQMRDRLVRRGLEQRINGKGQSSDRRDQSDIKGYGCTNN